MDAKRCCNFCFWEVGRQVKCKINILIRTNFMEVKVFVEVRSEDTEGEEVLWEQSHYLPRTQPSYLIITLERLMGMDNHKVCRVSWPRHATRDTWRVTCLGRPEEIVIVAVVMLIWLWSCVLFYLRSATFLFLEWVLIYPTPQGGIFLTRSFWLHLSFVISQK